MPHHKFNRLSHLINSLFLLINLDKIYNKNKTKKQKKKKQKKKKLKILSLKKKKN